MAHISVSNLVFSLILLLAVPTAAGPACARRNWKGHDCISACSSKWGWPGKVMGSDPWGSVMKPAAGSEGMGAAIQQACGSTTINSASSSSLPVSTSTSAVASTLSSEVTSATSSIVSSASNVLIISSSVPTTTSVSTTKKKFSTSTRPATSHTTSVTSYTTSATSHTISASSSKVTSSKARPPSTTSTEATSAKATTTSAANSGTTNSAPANDGGDTSSSDIDAYLEGHNSVRAQHGASPLSWNNTLASKAQQWANGCVFQHSGGSLGPFGENLAAGTGDSYGISAAITSWTNEVSEYDASNPRPSHFTQVVWKATTQVGCAVQSCDGIFDPSYGKAKFYVCEYSPQGNVIGEFAQNVQA